MDTTGHFDYLSLQNTGHSSVRAFPAISPCSALKNSDSHLLRSTINTSSIFSCSSSYNFDFQWPQTFTGTGTPCEAESNTSRNSWLRDFPDPLQRRVRRCIGLTIVPFTLCMMGCIWKVPLCSLVLACNGAHVRAYINGRGKYWTQRGSHDASPSPSCTLIVFPYKSKTRET